VPQDGQLISERVNGARLDNFTIASRIYIEPGPFYLGKEKIMDPRWNLLRNGIITIIASLALAFGLALLSGGARAASPNDSIGLTGLFTTEVISSSEPWSGRTI
jgi:hypothetical protein